MYIYLYLFILPSLKSCFFLAECDKQDEVDKCWLYFFISSNLSLFFFPFRMTACSQKANKETPTEKASAKQLMFLRLDSTK